jgi:diadenosine tetraphosphate (Ap4A) HIT family hydrolase
MVTVLRADGMRVVIFANGHPPAHVHVIAGRGEAKIDLLGADGRPALVWADGVTRAELRRAWRLVAEQHAFLLQRWDEIHERPRLG